MCNLTTCIAMTTDHFFVYLVRLFSFSYKYIIHTVDVWIVDFVHGHFNTLAVSISLCH